MSVCAFPGCAAVRKRAGFPSPLPPHPCLLSVTSLIGPQTLLSSVLFSLPVLPSPCPPSTLWHLGQAARPPPHLLSLEKRRHRPNQSRSEKHRWPPTLGRVHGKHGSASPLLLLAVSSIIPPASSAVPNSPSSSLTLASGSQSGLISFELHCV